MTNRKNLFFSAIVGILLASEASSTDIEQNTARLQAMDKITGRVSEIDVPVNGLANYGTFSILVRKCVTKSAEETPENTAFVDIVDNYKTDTPVNIFKGWMFSSSPALNAVEHPIYDVWLLQCFNSKHNRGNLLSKEQLALRDTIPMERSEKHEISTSIGNTLEESDVTEQTTEVEISETAEEQETEDEQFASEGEEFDSNTETPETSAPQIEEEKTPEASEVIVIKE